MNIDINKLAMDAASYILNEEDPEWHLMPGFLNRVKTDLLMDIKTSLEWAVLDEQGNDRLGLRNILFSPKTLKLELEKVLSCALSDCLEFTSNPNSDTFILTVREYIKGMVSIHADKLNRGDKLPPDCYAPATGCILEQKYAGAKEFLYNIKELDYGRALNILEEFKKRQVSQNIAELIKDGSLTGSFMSDEDFAPIMDIDLDITNQEMDNVHMPRDHDVARQAELSDEDQQRILSVKAAGKRANLRERARMQKVASSMQSEETEDRKETKINYLK